MRIATLEEALAEAQARVANEAAQAKRQAAIVARDIIVERFKIEFDEHASAMVALLHAARQSLEACAALGLPGPGEGVKAVVDITRIPSRTAPLDVLLWPPSTPLPNPAATLPAAFLAAGPNAAPTSA